MLFPLLHITLTGLSYQVGTIFNLSRWLETRQPGVFEVQVNTNLSPLSGDESGPSET